MVLPGKMPERAANAYDQEQQQEHADSGSVAKGLFDGVGIGQPVPDQYGQRRWVSGAEDDGHVYDR